MSHFGNPAVVPPGFDAGVSMRTGAGGAAALTARIAGAGFVGSESLHGCVLAAAFGVPWAPCTPRDWRLEPGGKFDDWFAYLGLPLPAAFAPADLRAARAWWDAVGRRGRVGGLAPLLAAFPNEV